MVRDRTARQRYRQQTQDIPSFQRSFLRNWLEYAALAFGYAVLAYPPLCIAVFISRVVADIWRLIDKRHCRRVIDQSMASLGIGRDEAAALAKKNYRHYTLTLLEIVRLSRIEPERTFDYIDLNGLRSLIQEPLAAGKGLVVATGHLGNWEWALMVPGQLKLVDGAIARALDNPYIDGFLNRIRTKAGVAVWYKRGAIRNAMASLKRHGGFVVVMDQEGGYHGVMAPFFGRDASTMSIPVELAIRYGAPILVGALVRDGRPMRFKVVCKRLHWPDPESRDSEAELKKLLTAINEDLTDIIREYPEQWIWILDRWKSKIVKERGAAPRLNPDTQENS